MRLAILAFVGAVIALQTSPVLPGDTWLVVSVLASLAGGGGAAWCWLNRHLAFARWLLVVAALAAGFGWSLWRAELRLAESLPVALEGVDVEVVGVVSALPTQLAQGQRFEFEVERRLSDGPPIPGRIMLSWYAGREQEDASFARVAPGERWQLTVRLKRPHGSANPDLFDYEAWLLEHGIRATGYVRPGKPARLDTFVPRLDYWIELLRYRVRDRFFATLESDRYPLVGVLAALAVGDQRAIEPALWNVFGRTGVSHLLAISGLHVTMVAALVGLLVARIWRNVPVLALRLPAQQAAIVAACATALFYAALAGFAVPARRTVAMLFVAAWGAYTGRHLAPGRIWLLSLLAVVFFDPWAVLAPGFWLSFGAVGALLYVSSGRMPSGGWRQALWSGWRTQWAATLVSIPILLWVFQSFSLVSPLANALAIPVVSFVVTPLAILAAILPWPPLLLLAHEVMSWLMLFLNLCAAWPVWHAPAPGMPAVVLSMVGVGLLLLPRGIIFRWLGGILLAPLLFWVSQAPPHGEAQITVLDVGQGLSVVIRTREHAMVYDPGPLYSAESDAGQRVVVPFLRARGINALDVLMVTHRDADHAGGMASVLAAVPVGQVSGSQEGLPQRCLAGQQWHWDGVSFAVLYPGEAEYEAARLAKKQKDTKSNHLSCVLQIATAGGKILLTSDIEAEDEGKLVERYGEALASSVLLVPHHGSRTSSSAAFLEQVAPQGAIIPVGYRNRFGHPKAEVMARYEARQAGIWRTDRDGAVSVRLGSEVPAISGWREQRPHYWHGR